MKYNIDKLYRNQAVLEYIDQYMEDTVFSAIPFLSLAELADYEIPYDDMIYKVTINPLTGRHYSKYYGEGEVDEILKEEGLKEQIERILAEKVRLSYASKIKQDEELMRCAE